VPHNGCDPDAAYDPDRPCTAVSLQAPTGAAITAGSVGCDPDAAFDPQAPCRQARIGAAEPAFAPPPTPAGLMPAHVTLAAAAVDSQAAQAGGPEWAIQVGALFSPALASSAASQARMADPALLGPARVVVSRTTLAGGYLLYRARLAGLSGSAAADACAGLNRQGLACIVVPPDQGS
jgi:D-alanyl-D-alanine carboxypeptidase